MLKKYVILFLVFTILLIPAYAEPVAKPTSAGTINVKLETTPLKPSSGDQTQMIISFLNIKENKLQVHVDYKVSVFKEDNQVFGIPITHTAEGMVTIPVQFQTDGTYKVVVEVDGLVFQPIPPETVDFTVYVGSGTTPAIPEFGPIAGLIILLSIVGVVVLSKKNQNHF